MAAHADAPAVEEAALRAPLCGQQGGAAGGAGLQGVLLRGEAHALQILLLGLQLLQPRAAVGRASSSAVAAAQLFQAEGLGAQQDGVSVYQSQKQQVRGHRTRVSLGGQGAQQSGGDSTLLNWKRREEDGLLIPINPVLLGTEL